MLTLGPSNSVVESIFSHLTAMLSDRRLSLNHSTMEDLLILKCNASFFGPAEFEDLVERSLDVFLSKRRKRKLNEPVVAVLDGAKKRKEKETEEVCEEEKQDVMYPYSDLSEDESQSEDEICAIDCDDHLDGDDLFAV